MTRYVGLHLRVFHEEKDGKHEKSEKKVGE